MKEFSTAVRATTPEPGSTDVRPLTTKIDGEQVWFRTASVGQISMAISAGYAGDRSESIATIINLFFGLITDPPEGEDGSGKHVVTAHFRHRLFDVNDNFDPMVMSQVLQWLLEEWSADPTQPSSGSTDTPLPTGAGSTGRG